MLKIRIIISGGGTGGHIFPALSIAKSIEKKVRNVDFLFVGAKDRMEMDKVPKAGYKFIGLWISGLQRSLDKRNLLFPFKLIHSIWKAKNIIKDFKPDLAIGTGGYASAPLLYVAAKNNIPTLIQEQNSYPGITNKILSKYVESICVAYDNMERFFPSEKVTITVNPIRQDILNFSNNKMSAQKLFDIDMSRPTLLVIGGSLGAFSINNAIIDKIDYLSDIGLNLIWQTGSSFYNRAKDSIDHLNKRGMNAYSFISEMDKAYAVADIIVSRSGAIAIAELCCIGKPVILVPSPNVAEDHQYKNAQSLVNKNASLLVKDDQVNRKLVEVIVRLLKDDTLRDSLSHNIKNIAVLDAADRISDIALGLIK